MKPTYFEDAAQFREWLSEHHVSKTELLVGFYKVGSGKACMTWSQSVDQALCFGWIDGVRKSIDEERYCIRFTPRKPDSIWSAVNIEKAEALIRSGQMQAQGKTLFLNRKAGKEKIYAYENETQRLSAAYEKIFKANKTAWQFFSTQAPSYQKVTIHWIMTAKREETQQSRLEKVIAESAQLRRLK